MDALELMDCVTASSKPFYCYVLYRPNGAPFYVGAGRGDRALFHEKEARTKARSRKLSIIRGINKTNGFVSYEIAGFFDGWQDALNEERRLIALYGRADFGEGPLANMTDGGDGVYRHAPDVIAKLSAMKTGIKFSDDHKRALSAAWDTPKRRAGIRAAAIKNVGRKATAEHKAKIGAAHKGRVVSDLTRLRLSVAIKGTRHTAEAKANMSKSAKARWALAREAIQFL